LRPEWRPKKTHGGADFIIKPLCGVAFVNVKKTLLSNLFAELDREHLSNFPQDIPQQDMID
jgi:hypothetical protein